MIFMLFAGTNFVIHYYLIKRDFKKIKANEELKFYFLIIFIIGMIISSILFIYMHKPLELSLREGFFQVISIITCTGFATTDYLLWPEVAWTILFFAMFLGGSTGSTAGGIKMARHMITLKNIFRSFRQLVSPHAILPVKLNQKVLHDDTNNSILTFIAIYLLFFVVSSILLVFLGIDEKTAGSAVATCMGGIGPGIGTIGPASNFAHLPDFAKLVLSFVMLAGRLEIYTILILFTPTFWMK
jgi:trk system potassium uptake protein TrkH